MAVRKMLARNHKVYINTDANDYSAGNWIVVSGINSVTWSSEANTVETSDFDS